MHKKNSYFVLDNSIYIHYNIIVKILNFLTKLTIRGGLIDGNKTTGNR